MKATAAIGLACALLAACDMADRAPGDGAATAVADHSTFDHSPVWAVDPGTPGSDIPAAGRSLFDFAMAVRDGTTGAGAYMIPPTFAELVARIEERLGCARDCSRQVLIPLGRSLQRTAASPGYFSSPRFVVALTGEDGPIAGRDRIYLGFQRRAGIIEVISYNETLGRFEFQLVTGYKASGTPQVVYAKRAVCIACHQNHGPIFSRQVWDETNANPRVAALLNDANPSFEGVPVEVPNAIDDATERANLVSATQRLWTEACNRACRASVLVAALQYRLSGGRGFDRELVARAIAAGMRARFPDGLAIPNPDLPNRDPLGTPAGTSARAQSNVPAALEALRPRAPIDIWRADDPELAHRFVTGIADLFSEADVSEVDNGLLAGPSQVHVYRASCAIVAGDAAMPYECQGEVTLKGDASVLSTIAIGDMSPLRNLSASGSVRHRDRLEFTPRSEAHRARLANGNALTRVTVSRKGAQSEAEVTLSEDFTAFRERLAEAVFPDQPFRRSMAMAAVDAALGAAPATRCCDDATGLAPAQGEAIAATGLPAQAAAFLQPCGGCHATAQGSPPNFLAGDAKRISAALAHCAPRIYVRLAMWEVAADLRDKVPMPPPQASRAGHPWIQASPPEFVAPLRGTVAGWLRVETGADPDLRNLLQQGYENLRPCLAAGA